MPYCSSCGSAISGGSSCSMCYGDPYHGDDGYYLDWIEQQMIEEQRKQEEEELERLMMEEEELRRQEEHQLQQDELDF